MESSTGSTQICTKCNFTREEARRCSKCRVAYYCSKECQKAHWPIHKPMCKPHDPRMTWAIELLCQGDLQALDTKEDSARFRHIRILNTHPIFTRGEPCPLLVRCGIPLLIYSPVLHGGRAPTSSEQDSQQNNQAAVYMRIEPHDGFAPPHWQTLGPGTCILARRDHRPLTREATEMMWKWAAKVINAAGYPAYDGWAPLLDLANPATFQMFSRDYYNKESEKGRLGFDKFFYPL